MVAQFFVDRLFYTLHKMKHPKAIAFTATTMFAALWACPLARAISFFRQSQDYFRETSSINASNDIHFSSWLLACYAISLLVAFAFAPGEVLWLHPEVPIH